MGLDLDGRRVRHKPADVSGICGRSDTIVGFAATSPSTPTRRSPPTTRRRSLPAGWNSLAGALGALGNYCKNRDMPFPWDTQIDRDDNRARMTLDGDIADAFRKYL